MTSTEGCEVESKRKVKSGKRNKGDEIEEKYVEQAERLGFGNVSHAETI